MASPSSWWFPNIAIPADTGFALRFHERSATLRLSDVDYSRNVEKTTHHLQDLLSKLCLRIF